MGNPNHRPAGDGCYDNKDGFIAFENNASPTKVHEVHVKLNAIAGPLRDTRLRKSVIVDVGTVPERKYGNKGLRSVKHAEVGSDGAGEHEHLSCMVDSFREG